MKKRKVWVTGFYFAVATLVASTAYALDNENKSIRQVEVTSNQLLLHLNEAASARPACASYSSIVGCALSDDYCKQAVRVALAAQLSGRAIDFELDNTCAAGTVGGVSRFVRIRTDQ